MSAYDDAKQLEAYSSSWSMKWRYVIPKDEVAARLSKDLAFLNASLKEHPRNVELLLLAGLVAHYAYNVDVPETYGTTLEVLKEATALAPSDMRGSWFHASFVCQTNEPGPGANEFLSIEAGHTWDQLSIGFWRNYMECMHVVSMPMHVLRAGKYFERLHAPDSDMTKFLVDVDTKRFDEVDLAKNYDAGDAWIGRNAGSDVEYISNVCGLGIRVHADWKLDHLYLAKGDCSIQFNMDPPGETSSDLTIFVERPRKDESLQDFLLKYGMKGYRPVPDSISLCPVANCISEKIVPEDGLAKPDEYELHVILFERNAPEFPGLVLEEPSPPNLKGSPEGPNLFHPDQILRRAPGKLYYAIYLNFKPSNESVARKDFEFLLLNMRVD